MRPPVSFPLHLELNSTRDGEVWPVAQNLVNDIVVLLKVFIFVEFVLMLGVLEVHVVPRDIQNTVPQLGLVPGFELRGTSWDKKGAWTNPLNNLTGVILSLPPMSAQMGSFNSDMAYNFERGDGPLGCFVLPLSMLLFKSILHQFGGIFASLNASTASLARPLVYQGRERLSLSLVKRIWCGDSPDGVGKLW